MPLSTWEHPVRAKRAALAASIPPEWRLTNIPSPAVAPNVMDWQDSLLSREEVTMTETAPLATLANIHAGIWSAEDVTRAFCHRTAIAHQLVNCLTEILFNEAISVARQLDRYLQETGSLRGPLHGLPISFMDCFRISGAETSSGFVARLGTKETPQSESVLVRHMRKLGAVPFCKTNVPQSMMLGNTTNNIFGSTANPFVRTVSAGGAAGGEGALLAMKGSPFGWATEIAGSARIPATFNRLYALRVSTGRLPTLGIASSDTNVPLCNTTVGMISWDLPFLQHMCRITLGSPAYQEDPSWLDMPFREIKFRNLQNRHATFAVLKQDGYVQPQPPVQRALDLVWKSLESEGYEVVEWNPPAHAAAVETLFRIIGADGASDIRANICRSGEPPVEQLKKWFFDSRATQSMPTSEFWSLCKARQDFVASYHAYWKSSERLTSTGLPIDGVIMPVTADAACFENDLHYFGYSAIVNLLDYTAVSFPVTFVDSGLDRNNANFVPSNAEEAQVHKSYNPDAFQGAPVGLQVMCRRAEDETALALAEIIARVCRDNPASN